jgi:hypothetical protein
MDGAYGIEHELDDGVNEWIALVEVNLQHSRIEAAD